MNAKPPNPRFRPFRLFRTALLSAGLLVVLGSSILFVDESEYVIVEQFGRITAVYGNDDDRGLHFKPPWPIGAVRRFDRRVQLFDPPGREVFTRDKKNITVDAFVCWKISDPVRFFRGLGGADVAEARLDSRVRSILSTEIGQVELSRLLSVADSETGADPNETGLLESLSEIVRERVIRFPAADPLAEADIGDSIRPRDHSTAGHTSIGDRWGIDIVDVRIKRINFPSGNQQAVFDRMRSERNKIAARYRSAGIAENAVIKSQADRQYAEIIAKAKRRAEEIRGTAEAEAVSILNQAHAQDPEFYRVMRTLDAYGTILNSKTTLVLSASSSLLKMLTEGVPSIEDLPLPLQPEQESPGDKPIPKVSARAQGDGNE